ncbi:transglutaminase-like domain-containing protein [Candidatus Oscillochloris fontis]|uniref:transglutaminase-like domain-containing protein n=1 Tax=Candidatus Oscillochloris fontis TaxID=2496868 RepID=UPI00101E1536|nr:transglutaminase-like domain-containing protein [Candidatus Oscillochloris fontis]
MRFKHILAWKFGLLGIFLFVINMLGLITPIRSPDLGRTATFFGPDDLLLSAQEVRQLSTRRKGETTYTVLERATYGVIQGMAHDWTPGAYNLHIPPTENWLLWGMGFINPYFQLWEFSDYDKALERSVGLCSQHAIVLNGLLQKQGIPSEIVMLGLYHVVNRVELDDGTWVIADPDTGVILPDFVDITPEIIRSAYVGHLAIQTEGKDLVDYYIQAYQAPVRITATPFEYNQENASFERMAYAYKWLVPLILVLFALSVLAPRRAVRSSKVGNALVP